MTTNRRPSVPADRLERDRLGPRPQVKASVGTRPTPHYPPGGWPNTRAQTPHKDRLVHAVAVRALPRGGFSLSQGVGRDR
jgi:hypothetical protein